MFFVSFRASPAYNPYYYGYAPYPAYAQAQQYPYSYVQNDGTEPSWGEYLTNSFWSYVPSFATAGNQATSEAETTDSVAAGAAPQKRKAIKYINKQNKKFHI